MDWGGPVVCMCMLKRSQIYTASPTKPTMTNPGNPYVYELYHNLLALLEAQGRPKHGVSAQLIRYADVPDELMDDPAAAFRHIAADAERQVRGSGVLGGLSVVRESLTGGLLIDRAPHTPSKLLLHPTV